MKKISICIVTYNNENNILNVLECIYKHSKNFELETFVVDSNSSDEKFLSYSSCQFNCAKALYSAIIEFNNDTTK